MRRSTWIVVILMLCAGCSTTHLPTDDRRSSLIELACPAQLPQLADDTFGATTEALLASAAVYFECRAAALGVTP